MNSKTSNPIIKSMRVIGDLDHEFYHDERQREVWNEAGKTGAWIAVGLLIGSSMASSAVTMYARAQRVDASTALEAWRPRALVTYVLITISMVGIVAFAVFPDHSSQNFAPSISGVICGVLGAAVAGAVVARYKRRKEAELETYEEL